MSLAALFDLPAPAKLNLFLHVIGRREDGYHLLQSGFILIDWADTLHLERRGDGQLQRRDLGPALPADDLCLRAARLLQSESGCPWGVDISIDKQVPWGAGMGGGSSDAATVLLGLNRLWGLNWPRDRLQGLGARLGADVPFFIGGENAVVEGVGEILTPMPWPRTAWAVVKPEASIGTAAIFASPLLKRDAIPDTVMGLLSGAKSTLLKDDQSTSALATSVWGRNDLQAAAQAVCPEVAKVGVWLESKFGNSRMTGSGSAVFARLKTGVGNDTATRLAAVNLAGEAGWQADWVGRICQSLDEHPLAGWLG
jgi:4-diphosphocytidyl-2-C-methyl-D-erythritol kinase